MLKLQFAARYLTGHCSKHKNGDVFEFDMGNGPGDEYERNGNMDVEKPAQGISFCFRPRMPEGEVNEQGKRA